MVRPTSKGSSTETKEKKMCKKISVWKVYQEEGISSIRFFLNAERAIPHFQKENWGMLVSDEDAKTHLISCEATCVHEEVAKRIPNVRFTNNNKYEKSRIFNSPASFYVQISIFFLKNVTFYIKM